jgi:hypothetical protein
VGNTNLKKCEDRKKTEFVATGMGFISSVLLLTFRNFKQQNKIPKNTFEENVDCCWRIGDNGEVL